MSTEDKKVFLEWIEYSSPQLTGEGWATWRGKRPPVAAVYLWKSPLRNGVYNPSLGDGVYALECLHGFRGAKFAEPKWNDPEKKLRSIPECPKCLSVAKKWSKKEKANAASKKLDANVIAFVSKLRAVPRVARIVGSIIVSIVLVLTFFLNDWEKLLELLRGVL